jgi:hypothetical protein
MKKLYSLLFLLGIMQFSVYAQDIALNKPTTCSSFEGTGYESSLANDGNSATLWGAIPAPQWWQVDLGGIYDLSSVVIVNFVDGVRYYHYNIQISTDGVTYTQVAEKTNNNPATDAGETYTFTGSARYVKVNMLYNSNNPAVHISDFQVFGTAATTHTISATSNAGGTISPSGGVLVKDGESQSFTITPDTDYEITDVLVDGSSVGAVPNLTLSDVTADHTIAVTFSLIPIYTITAGPNTGGTIDPSGEQNVISGNDITYTIAANSDFQLSDVLVDGVSKGPITTYTFTNVTADHTISASFTVLPHLALNKPATSENHLLDFVPSLAVDNDGSNNSYWAGLAYPTWWAVDLQGVYNVNRIVIRNYTDGSRFYHYNIEASTNGVDYTQIAEKTNDNIATDDGDEYSLNTPARYLRVNMLLNSLNPGVHISDFRVYGTANLTISGVTVNDKVYDGNTTATLNTSGAALVGAISGDNVTLVSTGAAGTFDDKTAGTGKTVTTTGFTITGTDAYKYILTQPTVTGKITGKALTVTGLTANSKIYDGGTTATLGGTGVLSGVIAPDVVTLSGTPAATFAAKNIGTALPVTVTGLTLSGADAGNYTLTQPAGLTANITSKALTVTGLTVDNKVYDGDASATLGGTVALSGVIVPDVVNLGGTPVATFPDKTVGTGLAVTVTGFTITGAGAGNYTLTQPAGLTANITPKELTITGITADNKPHDGNTDATLSGTAVLNGVVVPDVVDLGGTPIATFASADVADNIPVTVTGYAISGADADNYTLTQPEGLTANITVVTGIEEINGGKFSCSVYPNPTTDFVKLNVVNSNSDNLSYILIDPRGNILDKQPITGSETLIPMQSYLSGTYFIKIVDNNMNLKTIKIIKH